MNTVWCGKAHWAVIHKNNKQIKQKVMQISKCNADGMNGLSYEVPRSNCFDVQASKLLCLSDTTSGGGIEDYSDDGELGE